jgi:GNAT superfamily N-acetyltransferase
MKVEIRRLDSANFGDFVELLGQFAVYEKLEGPDEEAKLRLKADGLDENPKYHAFIVFADNKAVAFVVYFFTYATFNAKPTLFIEDIFVCEAYRGKGIGKLIFKHCIHEAKDRKFGRIDFAVLDWNQPAIDFYDNVGAERLPWFAYRLSEDKMTQYTSKV